ncbi:MAG: DUF2158 domain-containing protein [Alistipes sp.]|nr:DUF2158 domain-containing protein [Alistipes sp.]
MEEIKIGDVVRLKSGGEQMVVEFIEYDKKAYTGEMLCTATCVWHDKNGTNCKYDYDMRNLTKISD